MKVKLNQHYFFDFSKNPIFLKAESLHETSKRISILLSGRINHCQCW